MWKFYWSKLWNLKGQKCGQILCAHNANFLMPGHIWYLYVTVGFHKVDIHIALYNYSSLYNLQVNHPLANEYAFLNCVSWFTWLQTPVSYIWWICNNISIISHMCVTHFLMHKSYTNFVHFVWLWVAQLG